MGYTINMDDLSVIQFIEFRILFRNVAKLRRKKMVSRFDGGAACSRELNFPLGVVCFCFFFF